MLIVCPSCAVSNDLDPASLSANGRRVRCARCRTVWRAQISQADKLLLTAAGLGPSEQHEGVPILVAEGNINTTRRNEDVPRLKFILRNAAQIYSWTAVPVRASLSPGEGEGFRTRLASPPADARDAMLSFVLSPGATLWPPLLAEDDEALRALCARALRMDGNEIATACDGAEAFDVIAREDASFDLLLTDIRMPIMDGIALALAAAHDYPTLIILLMIDYAGQRECAHGLDAIIHDVIAKPFSVSTLRGAVTEAPAVGTRGVG
jgi:predicted Zn finger-like uncharacterized protein